MPSNRALAVGLAALVLVSGCSMLPGGADGSASNDGPGHHELAFYSNTGDAPYNGTLTVLRDGDTVHETPLGGDGTGTYLNVTTFEEAGPYTVVVNTSLPETGSGTMREEFTVDGALGNATVLTMDYQGVQRTNLSLPRGDAGALYFDKRLPEPIEYPVRVTYQGETVLDTTVSATGREPFELADLRGVGVYHVEVRGMNEHWTNRTVVVADASAEIAIHQGTPPEVVVYGPDERVPDDA